MAGQDTPLQQIEAPPPPVEPPKPALGSRAAAGLASLVNSWKSPARLVLLGIAVLVLWQFFGFSFLGLYRWYDPPEGQIFVDSPEVYTRERLINERSSEEAWLNAKLIQADSKESLTGISNLIERELSIGEGQTPAPSPPPAATTPPQSTPQNNRTPKIRHHPNIFPSTRSSESRAPIAISLCRKS